MTSAQTARRRLDLITTIDQCRTADPRHRHNINCWIALNFDRLVFIH